MVGPRQHGITRMLSASSEEPDPASAQGTLVRGSKRRRRPRGLLFRAVRRLRWLARDLFWRNAVLRIVRPNEAKPQRLLLVTASVGANT
jgi:hypothetical protein